MKIYRYSWQHCYTDWREEEIYAETRDEAVKIAHDKTKQLGTQITNGPELVELGEIIPLV